MAHFGVPVTREQLAQTGECAEVNVISSEDRDVLEDGGKLVNGTAWHTDDSFVREPCAPAMLLDVVVPSRGGDTQFANIHAAHTELSDSTKTRIDGLEVVHECGSSRKTTRVSTRPAVEMAAMPKATRPLVRTHPETGRKALYLNPNRTDQVVGMDRADSDRLLDELVAHAALARYQYRHAWRRGGVVIWGNRRTLPRSAPTIPRASGA